MRIVTASTIQQAVAELAISVNVDLPADVEAALAKAWSQEESPFGRYSLEQILANCTLAREKGQAMCQDTGMVVVYIAIGQDVHITGGDLTAAVNAGVAEGYSRGYLRKSVVADPIFARCNTGDNTPAVIHMTIVPGDQIEILLLPKGAGSENMGALRMLKPTVGVAGIKDFVLETVSAAGGNPCPPMVIGVGVGGTMDKAPLLAKHALARTIGSQHPEAAYRGLEEELLMAINDLGIGPQGLGGRVTALAVFIEAYPTHMATLPVAVNINCHAARHRRVIL